MRYLVSIIFMIFTASGVATDFKVITPGLVLSHIASVGAKKAVADYYAKPEWMAIKKGIASGSDGWLKVYISLSPVADGEAGEDLGDAIFDALPIRPFKVLPILGHDAQYSTEQVCTFNFESRIPAGGINAYLSRLEKSLGHAKNQENRTMANSCLRGIHATRMAFKESKNY